VTDRRATAGRPLAAVIAAALRGIAGSGLRPEQIAVQLREKDLSGRELTRLAEALRLETATVGARFYVNDRIDVALAVGADGVHLGGESLSAPEARAIGPGLIIAISAHGAGELRAAAGRGDRAFDFAFLGPIYDTPSKRHYGPPLGIAELAAAAPLGLPLVAVGGIAPENVAEVLRAGARGVACIRAVMAAPDPGAAVWALCQALRATV
jgi:thiamine-phosphate pyrophosphorylase